MGYTQVHDIQFFLPPLFVFLNNLFDSPKICEVIYGGKISDKYDRRQFNTYGNLWLGPQMFESTFSFFRGIAIVQLNKNKKGEGEKKEDISSTLRYIK